MQQSTRSLKRYVLVAVLLASCTYPAGRTSPAATPTGTRNAADVGLAISVAAHIAIDPDDAARAAEAINDIGFDLLREGTDAGRNAVLSPASIVLALAMARAGARGQTATEMDEVLRSVAADENAGWLAALDAALTARSGSFKDVNGVDTPVTLRIVNAPFAQADYAWEQPYLDALASRFGAGVRLVDYRTAAEAARLGINRWVEEQTERRIPELLEAGVLNALTRLVLVNAIYLKAGWLHQFMTANTEPGSFRLLDGTAVDVPTMHGTMRVKHGEGDGWFAVDVPYAGDQLSMLLIVPDDLGTFESGLDGPQLASIVGSLEDGSVALAMPRFGVETKVALNAPLAQLGMPAAFDEAKADFSGMTTSEQLFISAVIHQANIDVDETGTEASAATAAVIQATSMPPAVTIDRPFVFALRDRKTGVVLFLGRVVAPTER